MKSHLQKYFYVAWATLLVLPFVALADAGGPNPGGISNPLGVATLEGFISSALKVVQNIGFLIAILFIVYAGFLFVTARGNEEKLKKAKGAFLWAIVGMAVLLGAWVLATILKGTVNQLPSDPIISLLS